MLSEDRSVLPSRADAAGGMHDAAGDLLRVVNALCQELHPRRAARATLDSSLERDLGLDSLARVELLLRVQHAFKVSLAEGVLASAETPRELLAAVLGAGQAAAPGERPPAAAPPERTQVLAPEHALTLLEVLDWHARMQPERIHIVLEGGAGEEARISYGDLARGAEAVAAGLLEHDLLPGQPVAIMLPTSRDYFCSFFGVLLAGGIPVPIYPPARLSQIEDHLRRHAGILANARAALLITVPEALPIARLLKAQVASLRALVTVADLTGAAQKESATKPARPAAKAGDLALLQYTSGSTGNPKGVMLTHANLLANIRAMGQAAQVDSGDVFVSWLPLYHDMGLIGAWLGSLYYACQLVVMPPLTFLAQPQRWLWAIHRHRGTLSAAPNFAYALCLNKIEDRDIEGLDLASWRMAFNGAEPVNPDTVLNFQQRFARYGLRPQAMAPVYGLAESAVGLAFPPPGRGLLIDRVKREVFMRSGHAVPAREDEQDVLRFVACGQPLPAHQIRVVDATGQELGERKEGRLEFKGPSATSGYFRNPDQSRKLFHGAWLDSGDFAYLAGGDVYLTGRAKDLIIRGGRNIYPYELEEAVGNIPGIRKGCVAVFGSPDPDSGTERLVVLAETRETDPPALDSLRKQINTVALDILGTPADDVALAPSHTVLKTSSGKIRRAASRELYEAGKLGSRQRAVWLQFLRLAWAALLPQLRRALRGASDIAYAAYAWGLFWLLAPLAWGIAVALPRPAWSWTMSRLIARLFLRLAGTPVAVHGLENLPRDKPWVLVANHASYLDGILLVAALPGGLCAAGHFSFVAKRELLDSMISRRYLQHIGSTFVERFDLQRGVEDTRQVLLSLRAGNCPVFFPEGTFTRAPGLSAFRMGAFVIAAEAGAPVAPVTIHGTRSILRADDWFPRRGAITITIGRPLLPAGSGWGEAVRLRDAARAEILHQCGEPDLGE